MMETMIPKSPDKKPLAQFFSAGEIRLPSLNSPRSFSNISFRNVYLFLKFQIRLLKECRG